MADTIRVLLIEDDPDDIFFVRESLTVNNTQRFELLCETQLAGAIECLEFEPIDVILLDLSLPDSQGFDTFVELHTVQSGIPIIVLTGLHDNEMALRMLRLGAQGYLMKGRDDLAMLPRAIQYAIDQFHLRETVRYERRWERLGRETDILAQAWLSAAGNEQALSQTQPAVFSELSTQYGALLDAMTDASTATVAAVMEGSIQTLAAKAGFASVTPAQMLEIHLTVLKEKVDIVPHEKAIAYLRQGHLALLTLIGSLAYVYRAQLCEASCTRVLEENPQS